MTNHLQINDVAPCAHYDCDGVQAAFTFPFAVFKSADLEVWVDKVRTTLGYTVSGAGISSGGSVLFAVPPAQGARLTLRRRVALARVTDFQSDGIIRAKTLNDELDYQVAAVQQVADDVARCIQRPFTSTSAANLTLPEPVGGRALKWNTAGDGLENSAFNPDDASAAALAALAAQAAAEAARAAADVQASVATAQAAAAQTYASAAQSASVSNLYAVITDLSASRTLLVGDNGALFRVDASSGPVALSLPAATSLPGDWRVGFVRMDPSVNAITVQVAEGSGDTIEGAASFTLAQQYDTATVLVSSGCTDFSAIVNPDDQTLARINTAQTWTAAQGYAYQALPYSNQLVWNVKTRPAASLDLTGNPTISATGIEDGRVYQLRLTHSGAARVPAFDPAIFKWGDDGQPSFSSMVGRTDYMVFVGKGSSELHHMGTRTGF